MQKIKKIKIKKNKKNKKKNKIKKIKKISGGREGLKWHWVVVGIDEWWIAPTTADHCSDNTAYMYSYKVT